jgi:hypothetical protein
LIDNGVTGISSVNASLFDLAKSLKQNAQSEKQAPAEAQPFTERENAVIEHIMDVILQSGLSSHQAKTLLERTITLLEWGEKTAPKTTH